MGRAIIIFVFVYLCLPVDTLASGFINKKLTFAFEFVNSSELDTLQKNKNYYLNGAEDNDKILEQNYPNPFNSTTTIKFNLPARTYVELNVYNVLGVKLATLVQGEKEAGTYSVRFIASDFPTGMYIYELKTDNFTRTRKMLYLK